MVRQRQRFCAQYRKVQEILAHVDAGRYFRDGDARNRAAGGPGRWRQDTGHSMRTSRPQQDRRGYMLGPESDAD